MEKGIDYLGKEISVGDTVIAVLLGYREFRKCIVKSMTEKQLKLSIIRSDGEIDTKEFKQTYAQVIKI
ncbi:MAG: hypothetical protein WC979_00560 [Candidatus Pacearchaeota archaeon]|jgi:hypothetical protein|nr:hypothetical protein [Clostridia bacterium]